MYHINEDEYYSCLMTLELLRDEVPEMTPDEREIVKEAHSIAQEHKEQL